MGKLYFVVKLRLAELKMNSGYRGTHAPPSIRETVDDSVCNFVDNSSPSIVLSSSGKKESVVERRCQAVMAR